MINKALHLSILFFLSIIFFLAKTTVAQVLNPDDPDINIRLRNPINSPGLSDSTLGPIAKYHFGSDAEIDPKAPQLDTMFSGAADSISTLYQLHERDGTSLIPTNNIDNWGSTLAGFNSSGTGVLVPASGYNIGGGYQATILYLDADNGDITLSYTAGGNGITIGYSMHFLNLDINPELVALSKQGSPQGKIIALPCGYRLGDARNELQVAIRDTGTFFDTRSAYDWWQSSLGLQTSPLSCEDLPAKLVSPGQAPGAGGIADRKYTLKEIACSDTQDPEYHSLRPYPASPTCGENVPDGVWLCGNDLVLRHTYNVSRENGEDCRLVGEDKERCTYNVSGSSKIYLDLAEADFPIMGNTENVPNAVSSATGLSDGQRVNEYVSWYLNGVINRAEEFPLNMSSPLDVRRLIDFSGPLRKLLPRDLQTQERKEEAGKVLVDRHNQIIECGGDSPVPCYDNPENEPSRIRITEQGNENTVQFPYTPFSSTEDSTGLIKVGTSTDQVSGDDLTVSNVTYSPLTHASGEASSQKKLYFAHLFESNELSETLQLTYKPQGYTGLEGSWSDSQNPTYCELLESRDNEGDNLYGELEIERGGVTQKEQMLEGTASYSATFSCTLDLVRPCRNEYDPVAGNIVEVCDPTPTCEVHVPVAFSVEVYTPKENDNIWNRLVGAHMSVVKRIFPQIGSSSPIDELKDIPGKTTVTYGVDGQSGGAASVSTLAGDPSRSRPGSQAQLFFPHLGSVQEYFLHGIQEALRPQGFASVAPISSTPINTSELCAPENFSDFGASADKVSCVCEKESIGGNPNALNTGCLKTGAASTWDYSVGLFQINLLVHPNVAPPDLIQRFRDAGYSNAEALNCPMAFSSIGETYKDGKIYRMKEACVIQDKKLLDICVDYYSQPVNNVRYAIDLAKRGGWGHWNLSAQACGLL